PSRGAQRAALRGHDAEGDLRQAPFGALGGDDQVAAESEDAADADRVTVDGGDDRLGELGDQNDRTRTAAAQQSLDKIRDRTFGMSAGILEVGAGAERAAAIVAGEDDAA